MKEIICYSSYLPKGTKQNISFMELLLDEHWAEGEIFCPLGIFQEAGGFNDRLTANWRYEFLLRAVQKYPFTAVGVSVDSEENAWKQDANYAKPGSSHLWQSEPLLEWMDGQCPGQDGVCGQPGEYFHLQDMPDFPISHDLLPLDRDYRRPSAAPLDRYRTDCYIAGKYQQELLSAGCFDSVIAALLADASLLPNCKAAARWMEEMISHAPSYFEIDDNTRPILIYRGLDTCYNTLNLLADRLAQALCSCGQRVIVFDVEKEGNQELTRWIDRRFKAIIGVQSYVFSIMMQDKKTNLHDLIIGPKYNMILDHPALMKDHIESGPKDYYLLLHDRNYAAFAKYYYPKLKDCIYLPPGGAFPSQWSGCTAGKFIEKQYDITFIGSYYNYRDRLSDIASFERPKRFLAARFLLFMRQSPDCPAEQAFQKALDYYHIRLNDDGCLALFFELRQACFCIMHYYREKIIHTLLDAGIEIHVYSSTWQNAPFFGHEKLICHPALSAEESLDIMARSKISLNIMSWHKDGLTERVLNAMLCRSVVLSDRSLALEENFANGKDLLLFSLNQIGRLPGMIKDLLEDEARLGTISRNGFEKAFANHQWKNRAERFLEVLRNRL